MKVLGAILLSLFIPNALTLILYVAFNTPFFEMKGVFYAMVIGFWISRYYELKENYDEK